MSSAPTRCRTFLSYIVVVIVIIVVIVVIVVVVVVVVGRAERSEPRHDYLRLPGLASLGPAYFYRFGGTFAIDSRMSRVLRTSSANSNSVIPKSN